MCEVKVKLITKENICSRALFFWVVVTITETALPRAFETGGNIIFSGNLTVRETKKKISLGHYAQA